MNLKRLLKILTVFALVLSLAVLFACASPSSPLPSPGASPGVSPTATSGGGAATTIDLVAKNMTFDKQTITVPAGANITINFDNQDAGIQHNFAIYTNQTANSRVFAGQIITGPAKTTYSFRSPDAPGNYFFRCDVHPTQMNGTLVVQ